MTQTGQCLVTIHLDEAMEALSAYVMLDEAII